ncbi:cytochrome P450 [Streptomyces nanshensis]|uniref:cytochrome P450 n=1 Tax=Streptomyces nanshensis TaxID=518642 RepID=UPI00085CA349|nr:cytochrome P450 [Streptomyces nanshensis]
MTTPPPGQARPASSCPMLYGPDFAARPDVTYDQLRDAGPVGWAEISPGVHALVVTDYRAALTLLNDNATYSKDARRWQALRDGQIPPRSPVRALMEWRPSALYADDHEHARLRWAMDDCTARISSHRLREITRRCALSLINKVAGCGAADLMADYADTLPLLIFAELLGCPAEIAARMVSACQAIIAADHRAAQGSADFAMLLAELIQIKRAQPGQDFTTWMLNHPAALTDEEILNQLYCWTGAGLIPTAAWIGWALLRLLRDETFAGNLASGALTVRHALEEVLWLKSPIANMAVHFAREDTHLHGRRIPRGVPVMISLAGANTDPNLPKDLGYDNRSNLAFSGGSHRCPAMGEATTIAQTGIETAFDRLWDMELASPDEKVINRQGPFHQCPDRIPVHFRPKSVDGTSLATSTRR